MVDVFGDGDQVGWDIQLIRHLPHLFVVLEDSWVGRGVNGGATLSEVEVLMEGLPCLR